MKQFNKLALAVLISIASSAQAAEQCTTEQIDALDTCVTNAVASCLEATPSCTARQVRIDDVVDKALSRCVYKTDGVTERPEKACRACLTALITDLRKGASKLLWPVFTAQVNDELRDLRAQCGQADTDDGNGQDGAENQTPKEKFCEKFPNAKICQK